MPLSTKTTLIFLPYNDLRKIKNRSALGRGGSLYYRPSSHSSGRHSIMTYRGKLLAGCAFFCVACNWLTLAWAAIPRRSVESYDPTGQMTDSPARKSRSIYPPCESSARHSRKQLPNRSFPATSKSPMQPHARVRSALAQWRRTASRRHDARDPARRHARHAECRPSSGIEYRTGGYDSDPMAVENPFAFNESWTWQVLPDSILYKSYLAGNHESRLGSQIGAYQQPGQFLGRDARRPGGYSPLRHFRSLLARGLSARYRRRRLSAVEFGPRSRSRFGRFPCRHSPHHAPRILADEIRLLSSKFALGRRVHGAQQHARSAQLRARKLDVRRGIVFESEFPAL